MLEQSILPDQLPGEKVVLVMRRDLFILLKKVFWFLFLLSLVFVIREIMLFSFIDFFTSNLYPLFLLGSYTFILFAWLFLFFSVVDYILDIWYVTNFRIIDVHQNGFFSRKVAEQYVNRIQDVSSEVSGVMPTLLHYGNVRIQTAGEQEQFLFEEVPNPENVRKVIMELILKYHDEGPKD